MSDDFSLQVTEILETLNGESSAAGLPCVLLRLTGCPLRCVYCDTTYAYAGGQKMCWAEIRAAVQSFSWRRVLLTGGEPLGQKHSLDLIQALLTEGYEIWLESSGAVDVSQVPVQVHKVLDVKAPSSGMAERMLLSNLQHCGDGDEVKFVVADRADFDAALAVIDQHDLLLRTRVLVGPVAGTLDPLTLSRWILDSGRDLRLNVQLHKLIFGEAGDQALRDDLPQG